MIRVTLNGTDERLQSYLRRRSPFILQYVKKSIDEADLKLQRYIVGQKLQGQVLHQRTGKGASSVRVIPASTQGNAMVGGVQAGGGPAFYLFFHEHGTESAYKIVPKNRQALAFFPQGLSNVQGGRSIMRGLGRGRMGSAAKFGAAGGVVVKSVMHPPIKERSFMRTSLKEMRDEIVAMIKAALAEAIRQP